MIGDLGDIYVLGRMSVYIKYICEIVHIIKLFLVVYNKSIKWICCILC